MFAAFAASGLGLSYVAATGFLPLLLIAAAQGVASSAINPLANSLALALAREGRMEYGPVRAVGSATFMVATAVAGWLLTRVGSWLVPWLLAVGYGGLGCVWRVPAGGRDSAGRRPNLRRADAVPATRRSGWRSVARR